VSDTFLRQKNLFSFRLGLQLLLKGKPNGIFSGKDTRLKELRVSVVWLFVQNPLDSSPPRASLPGAGQPDMAELGPITGE